MTWWHEYNFCFTSFLREESTSHRWIPSQSQYCRALVFLWQSFDITAMRNRCLTHLPIVLHICDNELGQHWFRWWLVACLAPSNYLKQCWDIVNWTLRNKLRWNTKLFIHVNAPENIICEMSAILSRGRWVKVPFPMEMGWCHRECAGVSMWHVYNQSCQQADTAVFCP